MLASVLSQLVSQPVSQVTDPFALAFIPMPGWQETLLIFGIVLLIFGPQKLPEIADAMGRSIRKFKSATREIQNDIESDPPSSSQSGSKGPKD